MIVPRSNALSIRAARFADDVLDRDGNYPSNELVSFREARRAYASSAILIKTIETSQYEPARPIGCIEQRVYAIRPNWANPLSLQIRAAH